jgi:hypothetical protein
MHTTDPLRREIEGYLAADPQGIGGIDGNDGNDISREAAYWCAQVLATYLDNDFFPPVGSLLIDGDLKMQLIRWLNLENGEIDEQMEEELESRPMGNREELKIALAYRKGEINWN